MGVKSKFLFVIPVLGVLSTYLWAENRNLKLKLSVRPKEVVVEKVKVIKGPMRVVEKIIRIKGEKEIIERVIERESETTERGTDTRREPIEFRKEYNRIFAVDYTGQSASGLFGLTLFKRFDVLGGVQIDFNNKIQPKVMVGYRF